MTFSEFHLWKYVFKFNVRKVFVPLRSGGAQMEKHQYGCESYFWQSKYLPQIYDCLLLNYLEIHTFEIT